MAVGAAVADGAATAEGASGNGVDVAAGDMAGAGAVSVTPRVAGVAGGAAGVGIAAGPETAGTE